MNEARIVCLGDSLTEAYGIASRDGWTHLLQNTLGVDCINKGISGDTTAGMLARLNTSVFPLYPSHIIIMGGTNDVWAKLSNELIISHILSVTRQVQHRNITCIIGIPPPCYCEDTHTETGIFLNNQQLKIAVNSLRQQLLRFAIEEGLDFIDFGKNMLPKHFLQDGIHPNEDGHFIMAQNASDPSLKYVIDIKTQNSTALGNR